MRTPPTVTIVFVAAASAAMIGCQSTTGPLLSPAPPTAILQAEPGADITAQLQELIDQARSTPGPDLIYLPGHRTHYRLSDTITISGDDITLEGDRFTTIRLIDNAAAELGNPDRIVDCIEVRGTPDDPASNITIRNLTIDANYWNQHGPYNPRGIDIDHANNITIEDVTVTRAFVGITFGLGVTDALARDCTVTAWHNDAFNASGDGVSGGARNITFNNCVARDAPNGGRGGLPGARNNAWEIEDGAQNVALNNCRVENCGGSGFVVRNHGGGNGVSTSNITFSNCTAQNVDGYGFAAVGDAAPNEVTDITLKNCTSDAEATFHKGVHTLRITGSTFANELVIGPTRDGIVKDTTIHRLRVWAYDVDERTAYAPALMLDNVSLDTPIAIHGSDERVQIR